MIHLLHPPEIRPYLHPPTNTAWVKTSLNGQPVYQLQEVGAVWASGTNAGLRDRELVQTKGFASAKLALLESGAVLASFPLLGALPGSIESDPFTVWFLLDAPVLVPTGIFGQEIWIEAGRHLMAFSLGSWVVFFKPGLAKH